MAKITFDAYYHLEKYLESVFLADVSPENRNHTCFYKIDLPKIGETLSKRRPCFWTVGSERHIDYQSTRTYAYDDHYDFGDFKETVKNSQKTHAFYLGRTMDNRFFAEEISEDMGKAELADFLHTHTLA